MGALIRIIGGALFLLLAFMFGYYTGKRSVEKKDTTENQ